MNFLYQVKFVPLFVGQKNFADVFILLVEFRGAHQLVMRRSKLSLEEYLKPHGVLSVLSLPSFSLSALYTNRTD